MGEYALLIGGDASNGGVRLLLRAEGDDESGRQEDGEGQGEPKPVAGLASEPTIGNGYRARARTRRCWSCSAV
jgi:hypothetical protein